MFCACFVLFLILEIVWHHRKHGTAWELRNQDLNGRIYIAILKNRSFLELGLILPFIFLITERTEYFRAIFPLMPLSVSQFIMLATFCFYCRVCVNTQTKNSA